MMLAMLAPVSADTGPGAIDLMLGAAVLVTGGAALFPRARFAQAMGFLCLGVVMSLLWLRLGSVDVGLAERESRITVPGSNTGRLIEAGTRVTDLAVPLTWTAAVLAVLALLVEAPLHPYRMQQMIRERGKDEVADHLRGQPVLTSGASYKAEVAHTLSETENFFEAVRTDETLPEEWRGLWLSLENSEE